jgi:single-strand DNA-binding protein
MNQFTFTGRLTKDCSINNAGNTKVINFTTAVDVGYGDKKHALFIDCARFSDNIKVAEYLVKGQQVAVSGEADLRTWESNGKHGANITCRVNNVELIGGKAQEKPVQNNTASHNDIPPADIDQDSLPF